MNDRQRLFDIALLLTRAIEQVGFTVPDMVHELVDTKQWVNSYWEIKNTSGSRVKIVLSSWLPDSCNEKWTETPSLDINFYPPEDDTINFDLYPENSGFVVTNLTDSCRAGLENFPGWSIDFNKLFNKNNSDQTLSVTQMLEVILFFLNYTWPNPD